MNVIIAGGRDFFDYGRLCNACDKILQNFQDIKIISGHAHGADMLGETYAKERGFPLTVFPADWGAHGKKAGFIRNGEMAKHGNVLIAFWDKKSKGTKHMIGMAKKNKLLVFTIYY